MTRRAIVIPARHGSARLPGKPLLAETGRPLIQHVYEQATRAAGFDRVVVATDDRRIHDAVLGFGGQSMMTRTQHRSGTDRIAEVAATLDAQIIVNLQGDEPEIDPAHLTLAAELLADGSDPMATLATPLGDPDQLHNPAVVKVVLSTRLRALYFSRAAIPHQRDTADGAPPPRYRHIGIYAYTADALREWPRLQPTPNEISESLEQLRALEHGWTIKVALVDDATAGIDTPAQYRAFCDRVAARTP